MCIVYGVYNIHVLYTLYTVQCTLYILDVIADKKAIFLVERGDTDDL